MQEALKHRMREPQAEPTYRTMTLKRRVGYGEYMDAEERSKQMDVDRDNPKHVQPEKRQKID
jgi:proline dehydrogenase